MLFLCNSFSLSVVLHTNRCLILTYPILLLVACVCFSILLSHVYSFDHVNYVLLFVITYAFTGNSLDLLVTCVFHACFFFLAAFILTFLGTPVTSRLLVIFLVPLNALAEINHGHSLDYPSLTIVIFTIVSGLFNFKHDIFIVYSFIPASQNAIYILY